MLDSLRRLFGRLPAAEPGPDLPPATKRPPPPGPEPDEVTVPEISVEDLRAALERGEAITVLDVREPFEWNQGHLPTDVGWRVLHVPMNSLPQRLGDLPSETPIAVLCAHGNRSYAVTHYLCENGYAARNVTGGIARWAQAGGAVRR